MGRSALYVAVLVVALGASGCAFFTPPAGIKDLGNGVLWAQYEATRRGGIAFPAGEARAVCMEPPPDAAIEQTAKMLLEVQYGGATGSASPELASRIVELAGRTQTVLVLRSVLYRACEQSAAGKLTREDIRAIYEDALKTVRAMTDADKAIEVRKAAESLDRLDPSTRALIEQLRGTTP